MRSREEIEYNVKESRGDQDKLFWIHRANLEVLLDIRDLLKPEVSGVGATEICGCGTPYSRHGTASTGYCTPQDVISN